MAPSDDKPNRSPTNSDHDNPFIAFKRYADEQLSSILQGVLGFPAAFTSSPNDRWNWFDEEARRRSLERDARLKQQERERSSGQEGSYDATDDATDESATPFRELSFAVPSPFVKPLISGIFNYFIDQDGMQAAFPVAYVALSSYSPLQLEEHENLREHGMKWRHAFEDLMALQNGHEMPSESERARYYPCSGGGWLRSMLERGYLDMWKPVSSRQERDFIRSKELGARQPENDADEDTEFTELDLYQNFLGAQDPTSSSETSASAAEASSGASLAERILRLLPDSPPATMSSTDILGRAIIAARKAVCNDNTGNYEEASQLYYQSLNHLYMANSREKDDEVKKLIWTKMGEYTDRVQELKMLQEEAQDPTSSSESPSYAAEALSGSSLAERVSRLLPDSPPVTMSSTDILGRAIFAARKAVCNDNAGNYDEAYQLYFQSLDHLFMAHAREMDHEVRELIWMKIGEYKERFQELKLLRGEEYDKADGWKPAAAGPVESVSNAHAFNYTDNDQGKPSVISTLTTTEKRRLPDGTVHTKVVLKKRFADGNEESSETVITTPGTELHNQAQMMQAGGVRDEPAKKGVPEKKEEKSKKGWFWS
ncbi:MAG: hypothetical protein FRX48_02976 [Lasallia pustulata]|uniref:MIT domain-containing protein n=1 Tax=Lasallia pustulata TaxID=136370 RepID=A0A5M8PUJ5_9LECA|nr:MAG: hypothetical protein FRX48_02976 [Lasallia pustulata]